MRFSREPSIVRRHPRANVKYRAWIFFWRPETAFRNLYCSVSELVTHRARHWNLEALFEPPLKVSIYQLIVGDWRLDVPVKTPIAQLMVLSEVTPPRRNFVGNSEPRKKSETNCSLVAKFPPGDHYAEGRAVYLSRKVKSLKRQKFIAVIAGELLFQSEIPILLYIGRELIGKAGVHCLGGK